MHQKCSYELKLPIYLVSLHPVFHLLMLKKCIGNPVSILTLEGFEVDANLSYEEIPVEIFGRKVNNFRNKK